MGLDQIDALINSVSREIQLNGEPEVRSAAIGEIVMNLLPEIDEIAYVRYASVYRSFEDVAAFSKEIDRLRKERKTPSNVTQLSLLGEPGAGRKR